MADADRRMRSKIRRKAKAERDQSRSETDARRRQAAAVASDLPRLHRQAMRALNANDWAIAVPVRTGSKVRAGVCVGGYIKSWTDMGGDWETPYDVYLLTNGRFATAVSKSDYIGPIPVDLLSRGAERSYASTIVSGLRRLL